MIVKNLEDTAGETPECGCKKWLEHWERNVRGSFITQCMALGCAEKKKDMLVGAHVIRLSDGEVLIVPLCKEHNAAKGDFEVSTVAGHVPPGPQELCPNPPYRRLKILG